MVLPKTAWLQSLGVEADWPMNGIPKCLHLDNAAEFKSRALRTGCAQYGIELTYRPVGRPHFGGHVERLNRTLMERLKGLPAPRAIRPRAARRIGRRERLQRPSELSHIRRLAAARMPRQVIIHSSSRVVE